MNCLQLQDVDLLERQIATINRHLQGNYGELLTPQSASRPSPPPRKRSKAASEACACSAAAHRSAVGEGLAVWITPVAPLNLALPVKPTREALGQLFADPVWQVA